MGLQTMPSIAWFPLAVLLFKLTEEAITFVVVLGAAPSIANGLIHGVDHIPPVLTRAGRAMGAKGIDAYRYVILPAAMPSFVAGLKQGWAFAWRSLMAGELIVIIANKSSLGQLLQVNRDLVDSEGLLSIMLVILIIGIAAGRPGLRHDRAADPRQAGPAHRLTAAGPDPEVSARRARPRRRAARVRPPAGPRRRRSAIVTCSSTRRTLTRFASQTSRRAVAGPSNRRASGRVPRTSASGPSTARMMSAIEIASAGRPRR